MATVIFSTIDIVLLMISVFTSFNAIINKKQQNNLAKKYQDELTIKKELTEKKQKIEKQKLIKLRQKINIKTLKNAITILKHSFAD